MEQNNRQNKNCVVFVTHKLDQGILDYLRYIRKSVSGVMDLLVLYDDAAGPLDESLLEGMDFFEFNSSLLPHFFHCHNRKLPNPLVALIECARQHRYNHYLLMENDIALRGDLRTFFQRMNAMSSVDYIYIATDVDGGPLRHWPLQYIHDNPFKNLYFAWSQLFMVSRRYLDALELFMKENSTFYYEFLLPTLAYNHHLVIRQFENFGYRFEVSWGPAELYEGKYLYARQPNTFYHPIKNCQIFPM